MAIYRVLAMQKFTAQILPHVIRDNNSDPTAPRHISSSRSRSRAQRKSCNYLLGVLCEVMRVWEWCSEQKQIRVTSDAIPKFGRFSRAIHKYRNLDLSYSCIEAQIWWIKGSIYWCEPHLLWLFYFLPRFVIDSSIHSSVPEFRWRP